MRQLPIRLRLASWYFGVLSAAFAAFALIGYFEMRGSIRAGVDAELHDRLQGFRSLLDTEGPYKSPGDMAIPLREHASGDLFQIADGRGAWIYRSPEATAIGTLLPHMGAVAAPPSMETVAADKVLIRVLTATVSLSGTNYRAQVGEQIGAYEAITTRFGRAMLISLPLLLGIAVTGGLWLSRRALLPVGRITREAREITVGNLAKRLEVPQTRDELQALSETLNAMLARLDQAFQRVTQFTADASHELKTPLALMRTMAEVPLRAGGPESAYKGALEEIVRELERTTALVDDLLCIARGDHQATFLDVARTDLTEAVSSAATQGHSMASSRSQHFHAEVHGSPIWVNGNQEALRRMVLILLDNATKYTPSGGSVTLTAMQAGQVASIQVTDTGMGIDEADIAHLFERFYRADKARSRDTGGAGLGLAIARWIATAHGGTIKVVSALGRGSTFSVELPLHT